MERQPQFPIGQEFTTRGKHPRRCRVIDIWRTYNAAGELVRFRYVATHDFAGQTLADYDVVETTISLGAISDDAGRAAPGSVEVTERAK